jgi:hypothetical protein
MSLEREATQIYRCSPESSRTLEKWPYIRQRID